MTAEKTTGQAKTLGLCSVAIYVSNTHVCKSHFKQNRIDLH